MSVPPSFPSRPDKPDLRYRREVRPLLFPDSEPEDERVPEGKLHKLLTTFLFELLIYAFGDRHTIGGDQFLFWNARDPERRCAPDAFVKLGRPDEVFRSWKTWERGTPELVVEVEGEASGQRHPWRDRLERYHELGAREVVRFDFDAPPGERVHVWDRIEDDLVERVVERESTPCLSLGLWWVVRDVSGLGPALRLARDAAGEDLVISRTEADARRIAELQAELARRSSA
jgi:hypothetical protein